MLPFRHVVLATLLAAGAALQLSDFSVLDDVVEVNTSNWTAGMRRWMAARRHGHGCGEADIQPDVSKCLENGKHDNDCCAKPSETSCADGYVAVGTGVWCWQGFEIYSCYPPDRAPSTSPDTSKCLEKGHPDNDCCAYEWEASCDDAYVRVMSGNFCYKSYQRYECYAPGSFSGTSSTAPSSVTTTAVTTTSVLTTAVTTTSARSKPGNDHPDPASMCDPCSEHCDCAKQQRGHCAQCIPCTLFNPGRPCKRDATTIASMVFTPWHLCGEGGGCDNEFRATQICRRTIGKIARQCWIFNNGKFLPHDGPQGTCISIAMKAYAEHNMAQNWKNVDDFKVAFQWSHGERYKWGDRDDSVLYTCDDYCEGWGTPTGELGACGCECTEEAVKKWDKSERCTSVPKKMCKKKKWCSGNGKVIKGDPLAWNQKQVPCSCDCKKGYRGERCEIPPESQQCEAVANCNGHGFASGGMTPDCGCDCVCWHGDACQDAN